jgi:diguanylate cyclase (GGDEF)-like protein
VSTSRDEHPEPSPADAKTAAGAAARAAGLAQDVSREVTEARVLELLYKRVAADFRPDRVAMHIVGADDTLQTSVAGAGSEPPAADAERTDALRADWRQCRALRAGVVVREDNVAASLSACSSRVFRQTTGSYCCVPLTTGTRVYGCMHVAWDRLAACDSATTEQLSLYGCIAAMAMKMLDVVRTHRRIAAADPLTGLNNARNFRRILETEQLLLRRRGGSATVIVADVDGLKAVNAEHGNQAGDRLLQALGDVLRSSARRSDDVARVGGDEFALLLRDCDAPGAYAGAGKIASLVAATAVTIGEGATIQASVCVGAAAAPSDAASLADALAMAKSEMRRAKRRGPGSICCPQPSAPAPACDKVGDPLYHSPNR